MPSSLELRHSFVIRHSAFELRHFVNLPRLCVGAMAVLLLVVVSLLR